MIKYPLSFPLDWAKNRIIDLPAHKNLSLNWNYGSILGIIIIIQIFRGVLLSFYFIAKTPETFYYLNVFSRSVFYGDVLRWIHLNFSSLFFFAVYFHLLRGLFFFSFRLEKTWIRGTTILILLMAAAFLGYVLPWGQISLWGATVITNIFSSFPIIGPPFVIWLWGDFNVRQATLRFFFSLHFLVPFIILALVLFHLIFLHERGSSSTLYHHRRRRKIKFDSAFTIKDRLNISLLAGAGILILISPYFLGDPENFILANPLARPLHIKPEWYFLWAYAILRAIPHKLGGVLALLFRVLILYLLPFLRNYKTGLKNAWKITIFWLVVTFLLLTWLGGNPVEPPYIVLGQLFTAAYFGIIFIPLLIF